MSGPDSNDINKNAQLLLLCRTAGRLVSGNSPLVISIAATSASVESPAKNPNFNTMFRNNARGNCRNHPRDGNFCYHQRTGFTNTVPVALNLLTPLMQKNHTARVRALNRQIIPLGNDQNISRWRQGVAQCQQRGTSMTPLHFSNPAFYLHFHHLSAYF